MIFKFLAFLKQSHIEYKFINGYEDIDKSKCLESDHDILLKKKDFLNIHNLVDDFCKINDYICVQSLHHDILAKNIFLYDPVNGKFLNLDLYGELSRNKIVLFDEEDVFSSYHEFNKISILSPDVELVYYLVKKLDKDELTIDVFKYLRNLWCNNKCICNNSLSKIFSKQSNIVIESFSGNDFEFLCHKRSILLDDFQSNYSKDIIRLVLNVKRVIKRVFKPTGLSVAFLGPDGSGKSTIINGVQSELLPYRRSKYFHLKPLISKQSINQVTISEPHKYPPYSKLKSIFKLCFFICQYNFGWVRNILIELMSSSLVIFDRYYDDVLVDHKRYRYGASLKIAKLFRFFIPKPDLYFILTTDPSIIRTRKKEVTLPELERQIVGYRKLCASPRYINIDVNREPELIVNEIIYLMMRKMNERY